MPSAAERTRTLVQSTCSAVLLVPGPRGARPEQLLTGERGVGPDGDLFLVLPARSPAGRAAEGAPDDEVPAVLELTDVAPVSVPHRIRGRAWISGRLTPVPGQAGPGQVMLRLTVGEASVDDLWGAATVDRRDFALAAPDPLVRYETELLQHLASAHGEQLGLLCGLVEREGVERVTPLALDRFGLRVRFGGSDGHTFDARFDFPEPVTDITALRRAMHQLFEAAGG
ncbi:DUF2470 domain-containing protein [Streptomyces sp. ASQP_92]|uniref:DUF2470 domain-containing protein n=1 Tax=Streptomyces sp. ASQP_92 TaxID=2979116 RepID=UPI0021C0B465|nr:DUF2470 domain-containing protein [Streptomyces sp. ASQP_92]MCT9092085.1 DUF2470 domain-containing protein [Streptomyces sp. ASQP_92]